MSSLAVCELYCFRADFGIYGGVFVRKDTLVLQMYKSRDHEHWSSDGRKRR